jgi:rubredoxin
MAGKYPSEVINLPSKGWYYDPASKLASGQIEIKLMTAKEENILSSQNLISKGIVVDKLLESLIIDPDVKFGDLLIGDKNGVMIAARILGYGKDYSFVYKCEVCGFQNTQNVDLQKVEERKVEFLPENKGKNLFKFTLPVCKKVLTFKLLTQADEQAIDADVEAYSKLQSDIDQELTTRLAKAILAINEDPKPETIFKFVNESFLARDSKAFREHVRSINPDIDLSADFKCQKCADGRRLRIPINSGFFWPGSEI